MLPMVSERTIAPREERTDFIQSEKIAPRAPGVQCQIYLWAQILRGRRLAIYRCQGRHRKYKCLLVRRAPVQAKGPETLTIKGRREFARKLTHLPLTTGRIVGFILREDSEARGDAARTGPVNFQVKGYGEGYSICPVATKETVY